MKSRVLEIDELDASGRDQIVVGAYVPGREDVELTGRQQRRDLSEVVIEAGRHLKRQAGQHLRDLPDSAREPVPACRDGHELVELASASGCARRQLAARARPAEQRIACLVK